MIFTRHRFNPPEEAIFAFQKNYLQRLLYLSIFFLFSFIAANGQNVDTVILSQDTVPVLDTMPYTYPEERDTVVVSSTEISRKPFLPDSAWTFVPDQDLRQQVLLRHPYFNYKTRPVAVVSNVRVVKGRETIFYALIGLLISFALLKTGFAKYYQDLFRVFFRTTLKQRQIREQLMQSPLPSLMYNIFFVLSGGLYLDMVLHYYGFTPIPEFWLMYLYCCAGLATIYFVKFIGLKICGWLFNMKQAADSYIFIVFIINKVIGIFLLPFVVLLPFTKGDMHQVVLISSFLGIGGLLLYRFILGFSAVRNEVRFNLFHFFLYLLAFEAAPLLLIYRVLLLVY